MTNYIELYDLERYLFEAVSARFASEKTLCAFDFFCIVIWKANRAKSKIARRLLKKGAKSLEDAVRALLQEVVSADSAKERLGVLIEGWGFRLPMASAILTVLYPGEFTIYDIRVCGMLNGWGSLGDVQNAERRWLGYVEYREAVQEAVEEPLTLREKDRYLWGQSFATQLRRDIENRFEKSRDADATDA